MVNIKRLRGRVAESGINLDELAERTNIERTALWRRMKGDGKDFTIEEVSAISKELKLSGEEVNEIFFDQTIA